MIGVLCSCSCVNQSMVRAAAAFGLFFFSSTFFLTLHFTSSLLITLQFLSNCIFFSLLKCNCQDVLTISVSQ